MILQLLIIFFGTFFSLLDASAAQSAIQPDSYLINALVAVHLPGVQVKGKREVETQWGFPIAASRPYRRLAYELLLEYANNRNRIAKFGISDQPGYNLVRPEIVMLVNRKPFCAGPVEIGKFELRGIECEEKAADEQLFGVTRLAFLHEIKHLSEKDYYSNPKERRENERKADVAAHIIGKCQACSYEFTQFFFNCFKKTGKENFPKISAEIFASLQKINFEDAKKMTQTALKHAYRQAHAASEEETGTHHMSIERGLIGIFHARSKIYGIAQSKCVFHQKYGTGLTTKKMFEKWMKDENAEQMAIRNAEIEKEKAQAEEALRKKAAIEKEKAAKETAAPKVAKAAQTVPPAQPPHAPTPAPIIRREPAAAPIQQPPPQPRNARPSVSGRQPMIVHGINNPVSIAGQRQAPPVAPIQQSKPPAQQPTRVPAPIPVQTITTLIVAPKPTTQPPPPAGPVDQPSPPRMATRQPTGAPIPSYIPVKNPLIITPPVPIVPQSVRTTAPPTAHVHQPSLPSIAPIRQPAATPIPTPTPTGNSPIIIPESTNQASTDDVQTPRKNVPSAAPTNQPLPPIAIRQSSIAPASTPAPIISPPIVYYGRPINQISTIAQKPRRKTTKPLETLQSTKIPLFNIVLGCGALLSTLGFSWYKKQ